MAVPKSPHPRKSWGPVDALNEQRGREIEQLRAERDEARELACACLDILRDISDEPMRVLFGVEDMGEMPDWFTRYQKPGGGEQR